MVLELLFILLLLFAIALISYRGAIHEYQILQRDYGDDVNWSELLGENLPIVVRNVPKTWIGGWTAAKHANRPYPIRVVNPEGKKFKTTWNNWIEEPNDTRPDDLSSVQTAAHLERVGLAMKEEGFTRWSFITTVVKPALIPQGTNVQLTKGVAEFTVLTVTDGAPLTVWLAHEGAINGTDLLGENPWTVTSDTVPSIGDVKYIEIRIRQYNSIAIPKHWYYALKNDDEEPCWYHSVELHSATSRIVSMFIEKP